MAETEIAVIALRGVGSESEYEALGDLVRELCKRLNESSYKPFRFRPVDTAAGRAFGKEDAHAGAEPPEATLGASDDNRGIADAKFWHILESVRTHEGVPYIIGITDVFLERGSFNREDDGRTCGVVTLNEWRRFVPPGLSRLDYLTYLVLCVVAILRAGKGFYEHPENEGCLLDECEQREQVTVGMGKASVIHCTRRLLEAGVTEEEIKFIGDRLNVVRRRDPYLAAAALGTHGLPFVAGIAIAFGASVVATVWVRAGVVIAYVLLAACVWLVIARAASARWAVRKWSVVSLLMAFVLVGFIAAAVLGALATDLPRTGSTKTPTPPTVTKRK